MSKEKYQMALNTLFMMSSEHLGFELNYEKNLMQELIDAKFEEESRKNHLIVGSQWECVCKTYGKVKIIDIHPLSKTVTFRNMLFSQTEKIDDFILCFRPLKEGE